MKWLNIGTNIAAIITALIAFFTLLQVKNQTEYSYRADIVTQLYENDYDLSFQEGGAYEGINFLAADSLSDKIAIRILNIGNGVSKRIEIKWDIDHDELVDTIQILGKNLNTKARYSQEDKYVYVGKQILFDEKEEYFEFILPINQEDQANKMNFPNGYLQLWINGFVKLIESCKAEGDFAEPIIRFIHEKGRIEFDITYRDIFAEEIEKKFSLLLYPKFVNVRSNEINLRTEIIELNQNSEKKEVDFILFDSKDNSLSNHKISL